MDRPVEILLAEDNQADAKWLRLILSEVGIQYRLSHVTDGEQALNFLLKQPPFADAPDPDLVLLDLNLPRYTGLEVLDKLNDGVRRPICITTGSPLERDTVLKQFKMFAPCYIIKPIDARKLIEAFHCFDHLKELVK